MLVRVIPPAALVTPAEVRARLRARAGWQAFSWTPPYRTGTFNWTCKEWGRAHSSGVRETITATFLQTFNP